MTISQSGAGIEADSKHSWRHENVGRLLLAGFGYFEAALMRRVHASGFPLIRYVYFNVLRHLDYNGTRIVELSARAGITKGAMGQIVKECQILGLVKLIDDPDDGRAKVVLFAKNGLRLMDVIREAMATVQGEMTRLIGKSDMLVMTRALRMVRSHLAEADDETLSSARIRITK